MRREKIYLILIWAALFANVYAQDNYPRIVGDIGLGGGLQYASAIGDLSETAKGGIGFSGYMEYAFTSRLVINFNYSYQAFSSDAPDTLILASQVYFGEDLSAKNTLNSFLFGSRFYSHSKASKQLFVGARAGVELVKNKLESDRNEENILTTIEEGTSANFAFSPEAGIRFKFKTTKIDLSAIYSAFSGGGYWGIRLGAFGNIRKW